MLELKLNVTSEPESVAQVRRAVELFCANCGADAKTVGEIGLVVNEAVANVIRHAYRGAMGQPIAVTGTFGEGIVRICLRDWGNGEDPSFRPDKTDPLTPGGLGLVCIRKLMDEVMFVKQEDGMLLKMTRNINRNA